MVSLKLFVEDTDVLLVVEFIVLLFVKVVTDVVFNQTNVVLAESVAVNIVLLVSVVSPDVTVYSLNTKSIV